MTSITRQSPERFFSTRSPYVPFVVLVGAVIVIAFVIRFLNTEAAPAHPLSGAPVGATDEVPLPQPAAGTATGSLSLLVPTGSDGSPLQVGPAAFPPNSSVALTANLPSTQPTFITVSLSRMAADGTLEDADPITLQVTPNELGDVRVASSVEELTSQLGAGIYRVGLTWRGEPIGGTDVALGLFQPSNVAIFDEPRSVGLDAGRHVGITIDAQGRTDRKTPFNLNGPSGAPAGAYARIDGEPHAYILEGIWAGHWLPLGEKARLD